jgi:hypothetical protein
MLEDIGVERRKTLCRDVACSKGVEVRIVFGFQLTGRPHAPSGVDIEKKREAASNERLWRGWDQRVSHLKSIALVIQQAPACKQSPRKNKKSNFKIFETKKKTLPWLSAYLSLGTKLTGTSTQFDHVVVIGKPLFLELGKLLGAGHDGTPSWHALQSLTFFLPAVMVSFCCFPNQPSLLYILQGCWMSDRVHVNSGKQALRQQTLQTLIYFRVNGYLSCRVSCQCDISQQFPFQPEDGSWATWAPMPNARESCCQGGGASAGHTIAKMRATPTDL